MIREVDIVMEFILLKNFVLFESLMLFLTGIVVEVIRIGLVESI